MSFIPPLTRREPWPNTVGRSRLSSKIDSPKTGRPTLDLRRPAAQAR